jgi:hypothetical protein
MKGHLLTADVWKSLTAAAKKTPSPAYAAVAYFGQGASKLLTLPAKSRLVVDASEGAVKSGQTCPAELKKLQKRGVIIYRIPNLHAKIVAFDKDAFIGSANVSNRSATALIEAVVQTNDPGLVRSARTFVRGLCLDELSPTTIDHLDAIYRPPRIGPVAHRARLGTRSSI